MVVNNRVSIINNNTLNLRALVLMSLILMALFKWWESTDKNDHWTERRM